MRQHKVVDQVRERLTVDRDAQVGQMREVRGAQSARQMLLGEEHFLVRPARGPPVLQPPLKRSQELRRQLPGMPAL
jgi:hypothetical protein